MKAQLTQNEIQEMDMSKLPFTKKVLAMNGGVCVTGDPDSDDELMKLKEIAASHG